MLWVNHCEHQPSAHSLCPGSNRSPCALVTAELLSQWPITSCTQDQAKRTSPLRKPSAMVQNANPVPFCRCPDHAVPRTSPLFSPACSLCSAHTSQRLGLRSLPVPHPGQDWWEVSRMGHSSYSMHLQAAVRGHCWPSAFCLCCSPQLFRPRVGSGVADFLRRKPRLALLLEIHSYTNVYICGILLVQTELRRVFKNPSERPGVHRALSHIPEDEAWWQDRALG